MTMKPGCFGSTLSFSQASPVCQNCEHAQKCGEVVSALEDKVLANIKTITRQLISKDERGRREMIDISESVEEAERAAKNVRRFFVKRWKAVNDEKREGMSKHAARDFDRIVNSGIDLRKVKEGINPFEDKFHYMSVIIETLFDLRNVRRKDVIERLQEKDFTSSQSLATRGLSILANAGILTKKGTLYCLEP